MDTNAIESFIVLYETKNMHKAAERLYISQQGLSRIIRNLEKEWETVLFERFSGGMIPTKAGDFFYQEALKLRKQLIDMRHTIACMNSGKEDIILACSYGVLQIMYPVLKQFEAIYPKYRVHWSEYSDAEADKKVMNMDADLGLCIYLEQARNVIFEPLITKKVMLLVYEGHQLWEKESIDIKDLIGEKIIMEGSDFHIFHLFQKLCLEEGFYPNIIAQTVEITFCQHLCKLKEGVSISVDFVVDQSNLEGVKAIPFTDRRFCWTAGIGKKQNGKLTEGAQKLEQFLLETYSCSEI